MFSFGSNAVEFEKDPTIQKMRQDVADQIWNIIKEDESTVFPKEEIRFVSFEDALRELAATKIK